MPIDVTNKAKRTVLLNLPQNFKHGDDARAVPGETTLTLSEKQKNGDVLPRIVDRVVPASLSWLPGETLHDLPDGVLHIEEFQQHEQAGRLKVVKR